MKRMPLFILLAFTFCAPATAAKAGSLFGELSFAEADDITGAELGLGYGLGLGPITLTPVVGALLYDGGSGPYREETFSNGQTVCRDTRNGRFADEENCNDVAAKIYGKLEATFDVGDVLEVGGGVRVSSHTSPYGTIGFGIGPVASVKGSVGKDYYAIGFSARF